MKHLACFIGLCISFNLNASQYFIFNESSPLVVENYTHKNSIYTLSDFRIRLVSQEVYGKTKDQALDWLEVNNLKAPKANLPQVLSESGYTGIFQSETRTNRLTLLLSADGSHDGRNSEKFFLHGQDIELPEFINPGDIIKINMKNIYLKREKVRADFDILMDKKDGEGYVVIPGVKFRIIR